MGFRIYKILFFLNEETEFFLNEKILEFSQKTVIKITCLILFLFLIGPRVQGQIRTSEKWARAGPDFCEPTLNPMPPLREIRMPVGFLSVSHGHGSSQKNTRFLKKVLTKNKSKMNNTKKC